MALDDIALVQRLGVLVESVHAVVYFAPEPKAAYAELGLRGFWRGYFASRAAPLGAAGPELVTALFGGFAPTMVGRAVPQVWSVASPPQVQAARLAGATAALRRLLGEHRLATVAAAADMTDRCVRAPAPPGPADGGRAGWAAPPGRPAGRALARLHGVTRAPWRRTPGVSRRRRTDLAGTASAAG